MKKVINVIIVEDDPMVLEVNKTFLKQLPAFHYQGSANSGETALEKLHAEQADLVLLDIYLPDVSGVNLLMKIRQQDIPIDVIAITAARDAETVQQLFRLGIIDYLVKPFRFERFENALNNYKKMWSKLHRSESISQEDIDTWNYQNKDIHTDMLPKGLSDITLKQIILALIEHEKEAITAEQLAQYLGLARVTVRRYLDYLEKQKRINVDMKYGSIGRPTHYYSI